MNRHNTHLRRAFAALMLLVLPACNQSTATQQQIVGRWENSGIDENYISFAADGTMSIEGADHGQRVWGEYRFLDDTNIEMQLDLAEESWLPRWLPAGLKRNPSARAFVAPTAEMLTFRVRVEIQADRIQQFIEIPTVEFTRVVDE